ncbi:hypothetical protein D9611_014522 [Ephemerocybe angulata]|uniref:DUF6589 domain-containing protein n=1 Tax=Ephemerocybe angulata TaxID=980116 RepID=A0A8H5FIK5_9AGAR|nr:hypothetical protein D9611_014522 [Tulosesus angulatus]
MDPPPGATDEESNTYNTFRTPQRHPSSQQIPIAQPVPVSGTQYHSSPWNVASPSPLHFPATPGQVPSGHYPYPYPVYATPWPAYSAAIPPSLGPPSPAPAVPVLARAGSPTVDDLSRLRDGEEKLFAAGLFRGIIYKGNGKGRDDRWRLGSSYVFPHSEKVNAEMRAAIVYRCMRQAGFSSFGELFDVYFSGKYSFSQYTGVAKGIKSFLAAQGEKPDEHPVAIVEHFFRHEKSRLNLDGKVALNAPPFTIPSYALPPSVRLDGNYSQELPAYTCTKHALLNWSLGKIVEVIDEESEQLLKLALGFTRAPRDILTWSNLTTWSITSSQETLATTAPALFTIFSTVAVNENTRKRVQQARVIPQSSDDIQAPLPPSSPPQYLPESLAGESDKDEQDEVATCSEDEDALPEKPTSSPFLGTAPPSISGVPINTRRDPWLGVTVTILMLLFFRYKYAIVFQTVIGIFLFTCNANRDIISILGRMGLTVAYDTILATLHILASDTNTYLQAFGCLLQDGQPTFLLLFDNVNKMRRAWQHTSYHNDEMQSGTAATLIQLEDVPPGALSSEPLLDAQRKKRRQELTVDVLWKDINWEHIQLTGVGTILRVWVKHVPALQRFQGDVDLFFSKESAVHPLRLRKSTIIPMRPTAINEATTAGTQDVLHNLMIGQLRILPTWTHRWVIMVCGDQLTIDRMRKLKRYMAKTDTAYDRHDWVLPIIQLWHLKWNLQKAIIRMNWSPIVGEGVNGLRHDIHALRREKFNEKKCDFYPAHHILEDVFEALILSALRLECEKVTGKEDEANVKLLDGLQACFTANAELAGCNFEYLRTLALKVYQKYLTAAAAEAAKDPVGSSLDSQSESESEDSGGSEVGSDQSRSQAPKQALEPDESLANTINFMRATFWYLEVCAAIAEGDIGRVFEVIKLLRFSFWGAGCTNYGNEMLELACNFLYEFSEGLKEAVLNNYLVNPSGKPGHWFELDLLQEHFNFWLKRLFNSKSHSFDSKHLAEAVGLNIGGFSLLRDLFPGVFGIRKKSYSHSDPEKQTDINILGEHYRSEKVLAHQSGRTQPYEVIDEFAKGIDILSSGKLDTFIRRTVNDGPGAEEGMDDSEANSNRATLPSNPIIMEGGETSIDSFVGGNLE